MMYMVLVEVVVMLVLKVGIDTVMNVLMKVIVVLGVSQVGVVAVAEELVQVVDDGGGGGGVVDWRS